MLHYKGTEKPKALLILIEYIPNQWFWYKTSTQIMTGQRQAWDLVTETQGV